MKSVVLSLVSIVSLSAFAASNDGALVISTPQAGMIEKPMGMSDFTEFGFQYSSLNDGSPYATVGMIREWDNGFAFGARGMMPMTYSKQAQAYVGQVLARFILLNTVDQMYIEPTLAFAHFNGDDSANFLMYGASYGYLHKFTKTLAAGGSLGVDYANSRVTRDTVLSQGTLYNKFSVVGSYYF